MDGLPRSAGEEAIFRPPFWPPHSTATTTYLFGPRGTLLFGCHLPGHWSYGMHGTIRIA